MPTLRDLITDIHANPAAYATAFPVSEPELAPDELFTVPLNPPSEGFSGASLTSEMFDRGQTSFRELYGLTNPFPNPGPPPTTATGVQIQEQNQRYIRMYEDSLRARYSSYGRPPRGIPFYIDRDANPDALIFRDGRGEVGRITSLDEVRPEMNFTTVPVREEAGQLVIPPMTIPTSEDSGEVATTMWVTPTSLWFDNSELDAPTPSTDRFYLDADGALQFGPR